MIYGSGTSLSWCRVKLLYVYYNFNYTLISSLQDSLLYTLTIFLNLLRILSVHCNECKLYYEIHKHTHIYINMSAHLLYDICSFVLSTNYCEWSATCVAHTPRCNNNLQLFHVQVQLTIVRTIAASSKTKKKVKQIELCCQFNKLSQQYDIILIDLSL